MVVQNLFNIHNGIHFIGIGGVSQSALAEHFLRLGYKVSGSDKTESDFTKRLKRLGATIWIGHSAERLSQLGYPVGVVVYTSAISDKNVELKWAKEATIKMGVTLLKRSQLLGLVLSQYKNSICVSGSHGKTTATAMIAHIFNCARLHPTAFIGGEDASFGNYLADSAEKVRRLKLSKTLPTAKQNKLNQQSSVNSAPLKSQQPTIIQYASIKQKLNNFVIAEACEYKKNFLDLKPSVAVVLNIDDDHRDSYANMEDMTKTFYQFILGSIAVLNADDELTKTLFNKATVTFGIKNSATYMAKNIERVNGRYSFTLYVHGRKRGRITLSVLGKHNIYNALSAIAVADLFNVDFSIMKEALLGFKGVKRRGELLGKFEGLKVYADYAHHPEELSATLSAFKESGINPIVVFQPHTYSRTQALLSDFVKVLSKQKRVIIYKTYPARERYKKSGSAKTLFNQLARQALANQEGEVTYADNPKDLRFAIKLFIDKQNTNKQSKIDKSQKANGQPTNHFSAKTSLRAKASLRAKTNLCEKTNLNAKASRQFLSESADTLDSVLVLGAGDIYQIAKRALGLNKK